jgi:hypothetical protein
MSFFGTSLGSSSYGSSSGFSSGLTSKGFSGYSGRKEPTCADDFILYKGKSRQLCYKLFTEELNKSDAVKVCRRNGSGKAKG